MRARRVDEPAWLKRSPQSHAHREQQNAKRSRRGGWGEGFLRGWVVCGSPSCLASSMCACLLSSPPGFLGRRGGRRGAVSVLPWHRLSAPLSERRGWFRCAGWWCRLGWWCQPWVERLLCCRLLTADLAGRDAALPARAAEVVPGAEGTEIAEAVVVSVADVVGVRGVQAADDAGVGADVLALPVVALHDLLAQGRPVRRERHPSGAALPSRHQPSTAAALRRGGLGVVNIPPGASRIAARHRGSGTPPQLEREPDPRYTPGRCCISSTAVHGRTDRTSASVSSSMRDHDQPRACVDSVRGSLSTWRNGHSVRRASPYTARVLSHRPGTDRAGDWLLCVQGSRDARTGCSSCSC